MDKFILKAALVTLLFPPLGVAMIVQEHNEKDEIIRCHHDIIDRKNQIDEQVQKFHRETVNELKSLLDNAYERESKLSKENKKLKQDIHDFKMELKKFKK